MICGDELNPSVCLFAVKASGEESLRTLAIELAMESATTYPNPKSKHANANTDHDDNEDVENRKPYSLVIDESSSRRESSMSLSGRDTESLAVFLTEQLSGHFPDGPPGNEEQIKRWLGDILNCVSHTCTAGKPLEYTELELAIPIAVERWRSTTYNHTAVNQSNATSFSLFDQLQGGFEPPVTVEEIFGASPGERISVLERVDHVDDILMDWQQLRPVLNQGLQTNQWRGYLHLHRKWFDQGRSSTEYLSLQYCICQDCLKAVEMLVVSGLIVDDKLLQLIQTWHDMWLDLMQQDRYSQDGGEDMEPRFLLLLRNLVHPQQEALSVLPAHLFALIDPQALGFTCWINHVTPQRIVELVLNSQLLPDIVGRCGSITRNPRRSPALDTALRLYSVAMLRALLVKTRGGSFPWRVINQSSSPLCTSRLEKGVDLAFSEKLFSVEAPTKAQLQPILDTFLIILSEDFLQGDSIRTCVDAIETILLGYRVTDSECDELVDFVKGRTAAIMHDRGGAKTQLEALCKSIDDHRSQT